MPSSNDSSSAIGSYFGQIGNEDARRWDLNYGQQDRNINSQIAERKARIKLAAAEAKEAKRQFNLSFGEKQREFDLGHALDRDTLGADILFKGSQLRGPRDWIQGDSYAQGVANGGLSSYLQSLRTGAPTQVGGGTATQGNPTPLTVGSLVQQMTPGAAPAASTAASGSTGANGAASTAANGAAPAGPVDPYGRPLLSPTAQSAVDATAALYQRGIANQPLGFFENMTQDQRDAFASQSDYLGRNTRSELEYYKRSRPGQGSALAG
jgi:hypothetical protein